MHNSKVCRQNVSPCFWRCGALCTSNRISVQLNAVDGDFGKINVDGGTIDSKKGIKVYSESGSTVTLLYDSTETVELPEGVKLDKNGYTAENVTEEANASAVSGTLSNSQIDMSDAAETFIAAEITGLNATESVVIKLYSGETQIATTTLKKTEYFTTSPLRVKIIITGDSSSWGTVWEEGMPRADVVPDKMVLFVDGQEMNTANVPMIKTGGEIAVDWAEVPGVNPAPVAADLVISTAEDLINFAKAVNENKNGYSGKLVVLGADIDLNNEAWTPIGASGDSEPKFRGTFDGQGYTISNLYVKQGAAYHSAGLFGTTIDNVHVKNATVKGNRYVAGIVGCASTGVKVNNNTNSAALTVTIDQVTNSYGEKTANAGEFVGRNTPAESTGNTTAEGASYTEKTVEPVTYVAQIGDTKYETLAEAGSGETVQLLTDCEDGYVLVTPGVTLDLNGHTLTADYVVAFGAGDVIDSQRSDLQELTITPMVLTEAGAESVCIGHSVN